MRSSERIETDNSEIVCCALLLHSEDNFVDWLFSHVFKNTFL